MKTIDTDIPILITGGTGFVGSHLVEALLARGFSNIFVTHFSDKPSFVHTLLPAENILMLDLTNAQQTFEAVKKLKPVWIFHLAAIATVGDSFEKARSIFQNNITLQLNLLEAVRQCSPDSRVLAIGSGAEYGMVKSEAVAFSSTTPLDQTPVVGIPETAELNPTNPYAVSKITQDLLALSYVYSYNLDIVRVRPFNHIGERQTVNFAIPAFASQIAKIEQGKQEKILAGSLEAVRDITDVKDVVQAYLLLLEKGEKGEVYNVGSGHGHTMQSVLAKLCSLSTKSIPIEIDPAKLRPIDVPVAVANIQKIKSIGWMPKIELEESLQRVLNEWRGKGSGSDSDSVL